MGRALATWNHRARTARLRDGAGRKDDLCSVLVDCGPDRQEKTIAKYKAAKEHLDCGKVNNMSD